MYNDRSRRGPGGHGRDRDDAGGRRGVPLTDLDPALTEVSRRVIGCAIEVHKALGPGFSREVYTKALEVEMKAADIPFETGKAVPVMYRDTKVGDHEADLFINDRFIVTLMAEHKEIDGTDRTSLRALLRAADVELGLIINFGERRLKDGLVRVLNPDKLNAMRGDSGEGFDEDGYEDGPAGEDDED